MGFALKLVRAGKANARRVVSEDNPYLAARREWDERYGDLITRTRNWRLMALLSGLIGLVATGGVV